MRENACGFLCDISCSNVTASVRAVGFYASFVAVSPMEPDRMPRSLSNSGMRERLVCARIWSIRGTRLLPPDIEREYARTTIGVRVNIDLSLGYGLRSISARIFPLASGSAFGGLLTGLLLLLLLKSSPCRNSPNPLRQSIRKAAYSVDLHADSINLDTYSRRYFAFRAITEEIYIAM